MGICEVPGIDLVCQNVGQGAAYLVSAPFAWLADALANLAGWLFEQVWNVLDETTLVDVTDPAYQQVYALLFGVAVMVMLIFFAVQLITALIRQEPGALGRGLTGLAKAVLGSFLLLTLTELLLEGVDQICVGLVHATGNTMETMGTKLAGLTVGIGSISLASAGAGALLIIFLAGLMIAATLVVWFSLLIRKALILVGLAFGPLALAGASWDAARGWFGKWASFVIAMIVSKLVLITILLIGVSLASSPLEPDLQSISEPVTGVVLMLIAAFAPYMAYKFISFMGADMYHLMSAETEAKNALNRPIPTKPAPLQPPTTITNPTSGASPPPASPAATAKLPAVSAGASSGGAASAGSAGGAGAAGASLAVGAATAGPQIGQLIAGSTTQTGPQPPPPPVPAVN